jgi:hypothetical protein
MRKVLGFEPTYRTEEAFADFGASLTPTGGRSTRVIDGLTHALERAGERTRALEGAGHG